MGVPRVVAAAALAAMLLAGLLTGCGKSSSTSSPPTSVAGSPAATTSNGCPTAETVNLAKTKFVLHAGLASGAFYHWIYQPFRAGAFRSGHLSRLTALVKAGLAGVFVVHELHQAKTDAAGDPTLCKVVLHPIATVEGAFGAVVSKLRGGSASANDLTPVDQGFGSLKQSAGQAGSPFNDQTPTASQLANPSSTGN